MFEKEFKKENTFLRANDSKHVLSIELMMGFLNGI